MKKNLLKILLFLIFSFFAYLIVMSYIFSNGYRDYKEFCSQYIPILKQYHTEHGVYPSTLNSFEVSTPDFRYSLDKCGYRSFSDSDSYSFYLSDGFLGVWGYNSQKGKWWYD